MRSTYRLVCALRLCLTSQAVRADTVACESPDLELADAVSKERVDAMLKQAAACVRERKPGRVVAILTQIINNDPTNASAYLNRGSAQAGCRLGELRSAVRLQKSTAPAG